MKVTSTGIENGMILDRFGSKGEQFTENGMPNYSIPLSISGEPSGTESFVIIMEDLDAVPVCGFSWIHWIAANLRKNELKENESISNTDIVQGVNSYCSIASDLAADEATGYGGPDPPNGIHEYDIHVYAMDTVLMLKNGFRLNDLRRAMRSRVIGKTTIRGSYSPKVL